MTYLSLSQQRSQLDQHLFFSHPSELNNDWAVWASGSVRILSAVSSVILQMKLFQQIDLEYDVGLSHLVSINYYLGLGLPHFLHRWH